jgi:hypothetical protein
MQIDQQQVEESSKNLHADECNANGSMAGSKAQRICLRMNALHCKSDPINGRNQKTPQRICTRMNAMQMDQWQEAKLKESA